MGFKDFFGI